MEKWSDARQTHASSPRIQSSGHCWATDFWVLKSFQAASEQFPLMSYQFEFDSENRILRCRFSNFGTEDTLLKYYQEVAKYAETTDARIAITDFSAITVFDVPSQTIQDLAKLGPALSNPALVQIIIAPAAEVFALAHMFQAQSLVTRPNLRVVRSSDEAFKLIEVIAPHFEPLPAIPLSSPSRA